MKKIKFIIVALILSINLNAQTARLWGTYYGNTGGDQFTAVTTDASGNIYVCGLTSSTAGIASGGFQNTNGGSNDAFLIKFDASGNRLWATYYGGTGFDAGNGVATDASGNVYLSGTTGSSANIASGGFQNTYGTNTDAFLVKFDASGNRLWATYYGGSLQDQGNGVCTDPSGNVYLTGDTYSSSGIASGGFQNSLIGSGDAFLVKFNSSGSRLWATYYGGSGNETGYGVSTDASSNIFLGGYTTSSVGISSGGFQNTYGGGTSDAFCVKFNSTGSRIWATYYGGTGDDSGSSLNVDPAGNIYLAGYTSSTGGIGSGGFQNSYGGGTYDGYLVKFNTSSSRIWGTYYGGSTTDQALSIATDASNNVYLSGVTTSTSAISSGGFQNTYGGAPQDGFVSKFDLNGNRIAASYYGGVGSDNGAGIAVDASNNIYMCGISTSTANIGSGGFQNTYGGGTYDGYLVKFAACNSGPPTPGVITGSNVFCAGTGAQNYSVAIVAGATSYTWSLPAGWSGTSSTNSIAATPGSTGTFTLTASNACGTSPQQTLNITVNALPIISVNSGSVCAGNSFSIIPSGANTYTIQGGSAVVSPTTTSSYTVTGTSTAGCVSASSATSNVTVNALPVISVNNGSICAGNSFTIIPSGANTYTIQGGSAVVSPTTTSSYTVTGSSTAGCVSAGPTTSNLTVNPLPTINVSTTNTMLCVGQSATLTASGASTYTFNPGGAGTNITVSPTVTSTYTITGTSAQGCNNTSTFTQSVSACTGIISSAIVMSSEIEIYPNPTNGILTISGAEGTILFYNILGEQVLSPGVYPELVVVKGGQGDENVTVDLSSQPNGIYFIRIGSITKKIIKQ